MKPTIIILTFCILFASCTQYKRFTYLQPTASEKDSLYAKKLTPYKLQPSDNLYIKVTSPLSKTTQEMFNADISNSSSSLFGSQGGSLYIIGYVVNQEGYITLPVLGKMHVAGNTIDEVKVKLEESLAKMTSDAQVDIKLLSFKISLIGEVKSPGMYTIFNDRATILDVLAMAGDITYNGNRKKILVLRSFISGTQTIKIDLTKRSILDSEKFYLQPNDIIYVEPYRTTAFRLRIADYSQFLTLITSTITAILLINNALNN
jgi:polysaccharide export outer membrane protein